MARQSEPTLQAQSILSAYFLPNPTPATTQWSQYTLQDIKFNNSIP
jgi:hypothetical protein